MRNIKYIVVHCTAGNQKQKAADVVHFHMGPKSQGCYGWSAPGYHYIVESDGTIVNVWPEDKISNGVKGHNQECINVCWIGGLDLTKPKPYPAIDNRTPAQKCALVELLKKLKTKYPQAEVRGHRDFPGVNKACPCFDAIIEYKNL